MGEVRLGGRVSVYVPGFQSFIGQGTFLGKHPSAHGKLSVLLDKGAGEDCPNTVGTLARESSQQWFLNVGGVPMDPVPYQHPQGAGPLQVFVLNADETEVWPGSVMYAPGQKFNLREPTVVRHQTEEILVFKTSLGDFVRANDLRFLLYQGG